MGYDACEFGVCNGIPFNAFPGKGTVDDALDSFNRWLNRLKALDPNWEEDLKKLLDKAVEKVGSKADPAGGKALQIDNRTINCISNYSRDISQQLDNYLNHQQPGDANRTFLQCLQGNANSMPKP